MSSRYLFVLLAACGGARSTSGSGGGGGGGSAGHPVIDRFSKAAGHLMVRDANNGPPGADQPIDLDRPPFITQALGPDGAVVRYYNFDVQPDKPAPRYRLTHAGAHAAIPGELDLVDALPGDAGYSDFWQLQWVEVPASFTPGSITSVAQVQGLTTTADSQALDCPIVPAGTTAHAGTAVGQAQPSELWYRGARVTCLAFGEPLALDGAKVPTSPIYVTFAKNPAAPDGGPKSGFRSEPSASSALHQTHNVVFSIPGDADYSPLWAVHIYDRAAFDSVHDANSADAAPLIEPHGPLVNCPIVYVAPKSS